MKEDQQVRLSQYKLLLDISDLSAYGIGVANNGGGTMVKNTHFLLETTIWTSNCERSEIELPYTAFFGDIFANVIILLEVLTIFLKMETDAIELYHNGVVVDLFGDPDVDGTGRTLGTILIHGLLDFAVHVPLPLLLTRPNGSP